MNMPIINEFDTAKFMIDYQIHPVETGSFGLDLDAPVFVTGPYGRGGLPHQDLNTITRQKRRNSRRDSAKHLQWYRPKSLTNLEDDASSIWSGVIHDDFESMAQKTQVRSYVKQEKDCLNKTFLLWFQSLDRRKSHIKAQSLGELNFGYSWDDAIVRGSVGPFMHYSNYDKRLVQASGESRQSLAQLSDHIDKYRDVAL